MGGMKRRNSGPFCFLARGRLIYDRHRQRREGPFRSSRHLFLFGLGRERYAETSDVFDIQALNGIAKANGVVLPRQDW
jgi:hypothetical protein